MANTLSRETVIELVNELTGERQRLNGSVSFSVDTSQLRELSRVIGDRLSRAIDEEVSRSFVSLGQVATTAVVGIDVGGEIGEITRAAIQEQNQREQTRLQQQIIHSIFGISDISPDTEIRQYHDDRRHEMVFQLVRQVEGGNLELTERRVADEVLWGRGIEREGSQCNCPDCNWRREARARERGRAEEARQMRYGGARQGTSWQEIEYRAPSHVTMDRAKSLLLSCLSPDQKAEFEQRGYFLVVGSLGRMYTINTENSYNVHALSNNQKQVCGTLCAAPVNIPIYDQMLAQKLWLENDEPGFLMVANKIGYLPPLPRRKRTVRFHA